MASVGHNELSLPPGWSQQLAPTVEPQRDDDSCTQGQYRQDEVQTERDETSQPGSAKKEKPRGHCK